MTIIKQLVFFTIMSIYVFADTCSYDSGRCRHDINFQYFNDNLLSYYLTSFNQHTQSEIEIFSFQIVSSGEDCSTILEIEYELNFFSPEVNFENFEKFYNGILNFSTKDGVQYFNNLNFNIGSFQGNLNIDYDIDLVSYMAQSGKLPNGTYLFDINVSHNQSLVCSFSKVKEIKRPIKLDLISPGSLFSDMTRSSIIYETNPFFLWDSDFCNECNYGIRIAEYDFHIHGSSQEALFDNSILPSDQTLEFYDLPSNSISFQPSIESLLNLEVGKHYVWQVKRSFDTTLDQHDEFSPIFIFEIRTPTKKQLNFSDPYLSLIQNLIGDEDFKLLFSAGGELERFITNGNSVWINDNEVNIDVLYLLVDKLYRDEIKIEEYYIE